MALALLAPASGRGEALSVEGAMLAPIAIRPEAAEIIREIDLHGDQPLATYVIAKPWGNLLLQRSNLGYWVRWDGDTDHLIDNRIQPVGNRLVFKVLKEDLTGQEFPFNVIVAYRTADSFKFGVFRVGIAQ